MSISTSRLLVAFVLGITLLAVGCDTTVQEDTTNPVFPSFTDEIDPTLGFNPTSISKTLHIGESTSEEDFTLALRDELMEALNHQQNVTGEEYVALISYRRENEYKVRYRSFKVPKMHKDEAAGQKFLYYFRYDDPATGLPAVVVAAYIPKSQKAVERLNKWVTKGVAHAKKKQKTSPSSQAAKAWGMEVQRKPDHLAKTADDCTPSNVIIYLHDLTTDVYHFLTDVPVCEGSGGGDVDPWDPGADPLADVEWYYYINTDPYSPGGDGSGSPGGGGPGVDCDTPFNPPPECEEESSDLVLDKATKSEIIDIYDQVLNCGYGEEERSHAFSNDVRRTLGLQYRASGTSRELDGYGTYDASNGTNPIDRIVEVKLREKWPIQQKREQSEAHIDELAELYNVVPQGAYLGSPIYVMVSLYPGEPTDLNHSRTLVQYANDRGVMVMHLVPHRIRFTNNYVLYGEVLGDVIVGSVNGVTLQLPNWISNDIPYPNLMTFDCNRD